MPKKKQPRARRAGAQSIRPVARPTVEREPGLVDRLKKNPFSVILGVIVVLSMVLGIGAEIVQGNKQQQTTLPPTPTPFAVPSSTAVAQAAQPTAQAATRKTYSARPPQTIDVNKSYTATIVTNKGTIKLELLPKVAPITVNSFVFLARDGYFDGLTFHRVESWVVQGGDPTGTGSGGPGYSLPAEFNATKHVVGTLAMARTTDPNSGGSQFYIVKQAMPSLDNQYTVFGQTIEGMDVVNKIAVGDVMQKITIEEK
jgi:cyclophilin family peptidyl-prolyl cis-trans isomerase